MSETNSQFKYPTVDFDFIHEKLTGCEKFHAIIPIGDSTGYVFKGQSHISKRTKILRRMEDSQLGLAKCTGLAINHNFLPDLMKWLEDNRKWKDGAYVQ